MKNLHIALLAFVWIGFLSLPVLETGCATIAQTDQTKLIAKLGVSYAVIKVTENHPEKAAKILEISKAVKQIAGSDGLNTVDLLIAYIRTRVDLTKLDQSDRLLASALIDEIGIQLKSRIGDGVLTSDKLLIVSEVAGWVEEAANLAQAK